jgi:hypothetical protein
MTDIRNTEIKIRVKATECGSDAINRYMLRNGYTNATWTDGHDLKHICWTNGEYELWLGGMRTNDTHCTFELTGNRINSK